MSKPEKMSAADFRRQFCDDAGNVKESKPALPAQAGSVGTGRQLVPVEIVVNGNKEIHLLFEGSELLKWWQDWAAKK